MRVTSRRYSPTGDASAPTPPEVTRAYVSAAALLVVFVPLLLALGAEIRRTSPAQASETSTVGERLGAGPAWVERLGRLDEAIQTRDTDRAVPQWYEAYGEAVRSRSWQALLDAGDRATHIDGLLPRPATFRQEARRSYLTALLRARSAGSTAGVLGAADAFERLGDAEAASMARDMLPATPTDISAG